MEKQEERTLQSEEEERKNEKWAGLRIENVDAQRRAASKVKVTISRRSRMATWWVSARSARRDSSTQKRKGDIQWEAASFLFVFSRALSKQESV